MEKGQGTRGGTEGQVQKERPWEREREKKRGKGRGEKGKVGPVMTAGRDRSVLNTAPQPPRHQEQEWQQLPAGSPDKPWSRLHNKTR